MRFFSEAESAFVRKIRAPHKNKIGTPPPPPPKPPPPKKEEFYGHRFSCRKNAFFPGVHKIGAAISGPRIADTNFTDTGIFLILFLLNFCPCSRALPQYPLRLMTEQAKQALQVQEPREQLPTNL